MFQRSLRIFVFFFLSLTLLQLTSSATWAKDTKQVKLKEGIVLAAFGTSVPEAKVALDAVQSAFKQRFPDSTILLTYTSQIIRKKLAKQGEHILSIAESLDKLASSGVEVVRIQPLHVLAGEEYTELERAILLNPKRFTAVYLGRPLMEDVADAQVIAKGLLRDCGQLRSADRALVLMGHGQEQGRAGLAFEGVRAVFNEIDSNIYMATVEGQRDFEALLADLKSNNVQKVLLRPLMVVAGDHARNDLAGSDEDSWASRLKKAGFDVSVSLEGLGSLPEAANIYIKHTLESKDDLILEPKKP